MCKVGEFACGRIKKVKTSVCGYPDIMEMVDQHTCDGIIGEALRIIRVVPVMCKNSILRIEAIEAISIETNPDHAGRICKEAFGIDASQRVGFSAVILVTGQPGSIILRYPSVGLIREPDRSVSVLCYVIDFAKEYTILPGDGGKF